MARLDAEHAYAKDHGTPWEAGKYDDGLYKELYGKIREKILAEHAAAYNDFWRLPDCRAKDVPPAPAAEDGAPKPVAEDVPPATAAEDSAPKLVAEDAPN